MTGITHIIGRVSAPTVRQHAGAVKAGGEAGLVEGATKTKAGRRTVTLPRRVVSELEQHRSAYPSPALVFTSPEGNHVRSGNLRRRHWAPAVALAGLDGFTFHDMRHTAVSLWVAAGASDLEVAKWAGHSSAAFTKNRYAHLFPEHGRGARPREPSGAGRTAASTNRRPALLGRPSRIA